MKRICGIGLLLGMILLLTLPAQALYQINRSVLGSGGNVTAGTNNSVNGTVGQSAVGVVQGANYWHHIGFWAGPPFPTDVDETQGLPSVYQLEQNHPNPFNPLTTIRYAVPEAGRVLITLYDIQGREVKTLLDAEQEAGWYDLDLDARGLASGVYFYQMRAGRHGETKKMVLLK